MSGSITISADRLHCMLRMTLTGFFALDDVARYADARSAAFRELGCGPDTHATLSDIRDCKIQAQDVLAAFARVTRDPAYRARRIAFITGSSLSRRQAARLADGDRVRSFPNETAALAWLTGPAIEPLARSA